MRKTAVPAVICGFILLASLSQAQQADAMLGFGTILSSGSTACGANSCVIPEKGGLYPSISADVIFHKRVGFNFEASWRARQGNYAGLGIPFLLAAFMMKQFSSLFSRMKRHLDTVERAMGVLMVITGIGFLTGAVSGVSIWLLETFPALQNIG